MGQSSSTAQEVSPEQQEVESLAASTGALPLLKKTFSLLSDPETKSIPVHSLQKCFELAFENLKSEQADISKEIPALVRHFGSAIVDLFFVADKDGVNWIEFLRGYTKCCARTAASTSFNNLFRVFFAACSKAGLVINLQFELYDEDCKINGSLSLRNVQILLWICWLFALDSRVLNLNMGKIEGECDLPSISHLLASAVESCAEDAQKLDFWDSSVWGLDILLPATKIHSWALKTLPNLAGAGVSLDDLFMSLNKDLDEIQWLILQFNQFQDKSEPCAGEISSPAVCNANLLTSGVAWAIWLTLRDPLLEEISKSCFPIDVDESTKNLLYRSSLHGKGLNRFWASVEGYNGPLLILIAASDDKSPGRWIVGALTYQGFENKDTYYGNSGSLYAVYPVFHVMPSSGREKNFVYSHLHPAVRVYEAHPKPVGLAFGGSLGNERLSLDEDFARITVRHHVADKTYQPGALFHDQGYLPVEATVLEMEVWGLGGRAARQIQDSYKQREQLFTEQRRKVDLKTFASWEDSPEKMMMDMMSNPNAVRREER